MKKVIQSFLSIVGSAIEKSLQKIGKTINVNLTEKERKKYSPKNKETNNNPIFQKHETFQEGLRKKIKSKKPIYSFKGSGHNGKGSVNKDSRFFNHPRKDVPSGRSKG